MSPSANIQTSNFAFCLPRRERLFDAQMMFMREPFYSRHMKHPPTTNPTGPRSMRKVSIKTHQLPMLPTRPRHVRNLCRTTNIHASIRSVPCAGHVDMSGPPTCR
jgi:hypothetical protein